MVKDQTPTRYMLLSAKSSQSCAQNDAKNRSAKSRSTRVYRVRVGKTLALVVEIRWHEKVDPRSRMALS